MNQLGDQLGDQLLVQLWNQLWDDALGRCRECGCEIGVERPTFPCICDGSMEGRCVDCGMLGERIGHMSCQYPQDHP